MSKNKVKTRGNSHNFNPVGEKLPSHRPATYFEIVKLRNLCLITNPNIDIREMISEIILPEVLSVWKKIHPGIHLRDNKAMTTSLQTFFNDIDAMFKNKRSSSKTKKTALEKKMKRVFNCSTCRCGLPEMVCR